MGKGLLFSQMEPPAGWEADFHDWYETEHIPPRMAIPGFRSASRYEAIEGEPRYLACYFLDDMGALELPEYQRLKREPGERTSRMLAAVNGFTRYLCDQISDTGDTGQAAGALFVVAFAVPGAAAARFDDWYESEHVPMLMQADGWLRVRRFATGPGSEGPPWTRFALHELRDRKVMDAPEREGARATPRRAQLSAEPWFSPNGRWLYSPIHTAHAISQNGG
ncbi:MAG TPA: hypothetical protein VH834_02500 [Solirubrobacteraceae bacterium]|jgi:hypothetical protein